MLTTNVRVLLLTVPVAMATTTNASGNDCSPAWSSLGAGVSDGAFVTVNALVSFDDGSGPALYAGGCFNQVGGVFAKSIARWNGSSWSALGAGLSDSQDRPGLVQALTVFDDGSGPAIYAGGDFSQGGVARWDGAEWSPLGSGLDVGSGVEFGGPGFAFAVFDDGSGPALYAGGTFYLAGGSPANNIARWDGTNWSPLGEGVTGISGSFCSEGVRALTVFDDGSGPALYAAGRFTQAGGSPATNIARWDGSVWSPVGNGLSEKFASFPCSGVNALTVFDDGSGPALIAGGNFTDTGSNLYFAFNIARWNGNAWSALSEPLSFDIDEDQVRTLTVYDDGSGPALIAGGAFPLAGGASPVNIASWNGWSWSSLGDGMSDAVRALTVFDDGIGSALFAGGDFLQAAEIPANRIARWGRPCIPDPCPADVNSSGAVDLDDLNLILTNFGLATTKADTNNDGVVDLNDLNAVLTAFGTTCP